MSSFLISNERGPLAIGFFLAVIVLVGLCMFMFALDEALFSLLGKKSLASQVRDQSRELEELRFQHRVIADKTQTSEAAAAKVEQLRNKNKLLTAKLEGLARDVAVASASYSETGTKFENYKNDYRKAIRDRAKGQVIGRLETIDGDVYDDVILREVTAVGIEIRHSSGSKRIPYEALPTAMQDHFQFDPKQKNEAIAREDEFHKMHHKEMSIGNDAAVEKRTTEASNENKERLTMALAAKRSRAASLGVEISSLVQSIAAEEAKLRRAESDYRIGGISRAPDMKISLARKREELSQLNQQIAALQTQLKLLK